MIRYTRRNQFDALAEARMQRAAEAGIPVRTDPPLPEPIQIDLRKVGGPLVTLYPCRRGLAWRAVVDGTVIDRGTVKVLLHNLADALPHVRNFN